MYTLKKYNSLKRGFYQENVVFRKTGFTVLTIQGYCKFDFASEMGKNALFTRFIRMV